MDEAMTKRIQTLLVLTILTMTGCQHKESGYGTEIPLRFPGARTQIWAVAPVVDLSGQNVDPLLQADLVFGQLQQVKGITVIPVNRVAEVYAALKISQVESE